MVLQGTVLVHGQEHVLYNAQRRNDHINAVNEDKEGDTKILIYEWYRGLY